MPITALITTNTFRDWFNRTNDIITALNSSVLINGIVANGVFVANGSLSVVGSVFANSTAISLTAPMTFGANTTVPSNCNTWNFACGTLLIQPLAGTFVNTALSVNATATFLQGLSANANVSISGDITAVGNVFMNGTVTANGGPMLVRQVLYAAANAQITPATLSNPQYDDFTPAGGDGAEVWNLSPNIDTIITGLAAPTGFAVGSRVLYIQNISTNNKITLVSANTSSSTNNRFKMVGDTPADLSPGAAVALIWSSINHQWRILAPASTAGAFASLSISGSANVGTTLGVAGNTTLSNTTITGLLTVTGNTASGNTAHTGWLTVSSFASITGNLSIGGVASLGNTTVSGFVNVASTLQVTGVSALTGNATFGGFANIAGTLQVAGNTVIGGFANVGTTLQVAGLSTLTGNVSFGGFANVGGTLQVAGNTVLSNVKYTGSLQGTMPGFHTTTYTMTTADDTVLFSGTFTVTLYPVAGNAGRRVTIKNIGGGVITVVGNAGETIDNVSSYPITTPYQSVTMVCDGTFWWVV